VEARTIFYDRESDTFDLRALEDGDEAIGLIIDAIFEVAVRENVTPKYILEGLAKTYEPTGDRDFEDFKAFREALA